MNIKKIKIYHNENDKCNEILNMLKQKLKKSGFIVDSNSPDLVIAVGGDGSFLRMVKKEDYNSNLLYVGINAGTLGFLQEIRISDVDHFIDCLKENKYKVDEVGVQETEIVTLNDRYLFNSLNEISIREKDLNTIFLKVNIDGNMLEKYVGDGLLISTSVGSTAYNLSFGGSIVYNKLHTLQITPIAPLNNKAYRNLLNSVIVPERADIKIQPINGKNNILVSIDGENKIFDNVEFIDTKVDNKRLKFIRLENYNYWDKVNEKFLSN